MGNAWLLQSSVPTIVLTAIRVLDCRSGSTYRCNKSLKCPITQRTRKSCQLCRFRKCEQIGMRRKWVLVTDDSNSKTSSNKPKRVKPQSIPNDRLTKEESCYIKGYVYDMAVIRHQTESFDVKVQKTAYWRSNTDHFILIADIKGSESSNEV